MKRPFADQRPFGPFASLNSNSPITIRDLRERGEVDHYDPINWAGKTPQHLFHNTDFRGVKGIMASGELSTGENAPDNIFVGATVEERFGDFTFVFDGEDCIDRGFSPRTYLIDEEGKYKDSNRGDYYNTNRGIVWNERFIGCYPEPLYSSFKYPNTGTRCNPDLDIPLDVYAVMIDPFRLEPTGSLQVNRNPEINLAGAMQQTFVRDLTDGPIDISTLGASHMMYVDRKQDKLTSHNREIAEVAASKLGIEPITNKEALDEFPQLTAGKPIYDTNYIV